MTKNLTIVMLSLLFFSFLPVFILAENDTLADFVYDLKKSGPFYGTKVHSFGSIQNGIKVSEAGDI